MPILELTTLIPGRTPSEVLDFCLEGVNFPKIFPERITPLGDIDLSNLRIEAGRQFRFRHWMFNLIPSNWTVTIREVSDTHFVDEMLKGPLRAFRHEHRVAAGEGGTLYTDRVTYSAIGGAFSEGLLVNGTCDGSSRPGIATCCNCWVDAQGCIQSCGVAHDNFGSGIGRRTISWLTSASCMLSQQR